MLLTSFLKCFSSCFTFLHFLPDLPHLYTFTASYSFIHTLFCPPSKRKTQKTKSKSANKNSKKKNKPQKTMDSVLCWSATPGYVAYPELWLKYPSMLYCRKLIFLFLSGIHYKHLLFFQGRELCLLSILSIGILSGLNMCWSCGCS